jgi:hypothetical protein
MPVLRTAYMNWACASRAKTAAQRESVGAVAMETAVLFMAEVGLRISMA